MKCKDCADWGEPEYGFAICNSEKFEYSGLESDPDKSRLIYEDYEGCSATVETGADFGCIHFKPKQGD